MNGFQSSNRGFFEICSYAEMDIPVKACFCPDTQAPNSDIIFLNHWHPDIEIWYALSGRAKITISGIDFFLNSGDCVIANSNDVHSGNRLSSTVDYLFVSFSPYFFFADENKNIVPCFKNFIENDSFVQNIFMRLKNEIVTNDKYSNAAKTGLIYELCAYIMRNFQISKAEISNIISSKRIIKIKAANDFIIQNSDKKIKIGDVARAVNMSESRLSHLFKEEMGSTVLECITSHRLYKALRLLETTTLNVSQIAHQTGFENLNYFIKVFKNAYKVTPSELRKNKTK